MMLCRQVKFKLATNSRKGFTLAEVLMTLTVIGIVAAMSIPGLFNSINDMQYKSLYKKAFADGSQAIRSAYSEGLTVPVTAWGDPVNDVTNFLAFQSKFNVIKKCNFPVDGISVSKCWTPPGINGSSWPWDNSYAFVDSSGRVWAKFGVGGVGPEIGLDTNGAAQPNKYGKDRFLIYLQQGSASRNDCSPTGGAPGWGNGAPEKVIAQVDDPTIDYRGCSWLIN